MQKIIKSQKFSWLVLGLKKFSFYSTFFFIFLSNFSCNPQKKNSLINPEDREVVEHFLRYMAISELGIYTILGSKPITEFQIPQVTSENESKTLYVNMPKNFQKKISFEKFHNKTQIEKLRELCNKWRKIQNKYIGHHFIIHFDEELNSGFIIHIPLVIYILKEYYNDFSRVLGENFDPLTISEEIKKTSSNFWKIFKNKNNAYLMGLLFGFGEKNAKFFQWEMEKNISFPFRMPSYNLPIFKIRPISRDEKIQNLGIPQFIVYQPIDEVVEKYVLEKERIIQIYKGKDFAETTIAYLKGEAANQVSNKKISGNKPKN